MSNEQWGIGNKKDAKAFRTTKVNKTEVELIHGEFPHSRSDNNIYARYPGGSIEEFDGHFILTRIEFKDSNYLKESELSGDEVRKGGSCTIYFDEVACYEFFYRDIKEALLTARQKLISLSEHPSSWSDKIQRNKLIGRKIWVKEQPYIIRRLIEDRGCIIAVPENLKDLKDLGYNEDNYTEREIDDPAIRWYDDKKELE